MSNEIVRYILMTTLCWGGFLTLFIHLIARRATLTQQRIFLLAALLAGVILPLVVWPLPQEQTLVITLPEVLALSRIDQQAVVHSTMDIWTIIGVLYSMGMAWMIYRFYAGHRHLMTLRKNAQREVIEGQLVYWVANLPVPFQFVGDIYLPENLKEDPERFHLCFRHEWAHSHYHHSYDLILSNLIRIIFWFQPLVHLLNRQLRLVHEFQADQYVLHDQDRDGYVRFLGTFRPAFINALPIHTIIQGPLKKRIMHMYQPRKNWRLHQIIFLCLGLVLMIGTTSFSRINWSAPLQEETSFMSSADSIIIPDDRSASNEETTFKVVEEMPRFPGCEEGDMTREDRTKCAQNKLMTYIGTHMVYPENAIHNEVEGVNIASFIVERDGSLSEVKMVKDIGSGTGEAVLKVFEKMESEGIRWIPGRQRGNTVRVAFMLPVKFKLSGDTDTSTKKKKKH